LIPDKILEKPGYIKNLQQYKSAKPMAGKYSEIGQEILRLGPKEADKIMTGPWGQIQM
jgi:hypothetical protein